MRLFNDKMLITLNSCSLKNLSHRVVSFEDRQEGFNGIGMRGGHKC